MGQAKQRGTYEERVKAALKGTVTISKEHVGEIVSTRIIAIGPTQNDIVIAKTYVQRRMRMASLLGIASVGMSAFHQSPIRPRKEK